MQTTEPRAKRVSIVIVSFNRAATLRKCLEGLGDAHQILVVDNGSSEDSIPDADYPSSRFIRLPKNFGLTKALNIGLRAADGEYVLFLHDDARINGAGVDRLAAFLGSRADVGAVCPLLLNDESGGPGPQARGLPSPSIPDPPFRPIASGEEIVVECVSGAAIMFRSFFLRALRQIDERYGNYGGIIDLCAQVRRASRKIVILREVTAVHEALESPLKRALLEGDRTSGTAVYLGKHYGFVAGMLYRIKSGLAGVVTFRFKVVAGAFSGVKIDGTG